jgi:hypothetical protein
MIRQAEERGDLYRCEHAWMGAAFKISHQFAVGFRGAGEAVEWYLPLYHFVKSCVALLPVKKHTLGNMVCFDPVVAADDVDEPVLRLIDNLRGANVVAVGIDWMSWQWQVHRFGGLVSTLKLGIRPFATGKQESFAVIGCRAAWWKLSQKDIMDYATYFKVKIECNWSLFQVLFEFCKATTPLLTVG